MRLPPSFHTARLTLRESTPADAQAVFANYASDPDVTRYLSFPTHKVVGEAEAFLHSCETARATGTANTYILSFHNKTDLLGVLDLRVETPFRLSFGYALAKQHWGQGLMPEALAGALAWAITQPDIHRFWAFCDAKNRQSARTMEKAGLAYEATLKSWFLHPNHSPTPRDCRTYAWTRSPS